MLSPPPVSTPLSRHRACPSFVRTLCPIQLPYHHGLASLAFFTAAHQHFHLEPSARDCVKVFLRSHPPSFIRCTTSATADCASTLCRPFNSILWFGEPRRHQILDAVGHSRCLQATFFSRCTPLPRASVCLPTCDFFRDCIRGLCFRSLSFTISVRALDK